MSQHRAAENLDGQFRANEDDSTLQAPRATSDNEDDDEHAQANTNHSDAKPGISGKNTQC